jgi:diguanylate cyclase (GGDEF)-like protein
MDAALISKDERLVSEDVRLAALDQFDVLDTPAEANFDRITRITKNVLDVPMAAVSLIDGHRQWLKSRQGGLAHETCKSHAFCSTAIRQIEPLIIEDATRDARFKENVLVVGPPFIRAYAGAQLRTPEGHNLGALCAIDATPRRFETKHIALLVDLAGMVMSELEALRLATTDSLTGTLSRRGFRAEADRAIKLSLRHRHPLSCIAFDLDHFKSINDQHGHEVGDRALLETVEVCRERLRNSDIFGRIGGEEFVIVLPHTDSTGALKVAEEIRGALERRPFSGADGNVTVTASFGITSRNGESVELDELLRRADAALYAAKDAGRNACSVWTPPAAPMPEIRRVLKAGQIVFNAGRSVIDCTVRGLGERAAHLDVVNTAGIPDTFKLAIIADGVSRGCNVTAKRERRLEVAFANGQPSTQSRPPIID